MVVLSPISVNTEIGPPEDDRNFYLQSLDYGNEDSVNYTYDSQGRLTSQTYEDGDTVTYLYDNDGALAAVTDSATGITTRYYYDFTGRTMKYTESASGYSHSVEYGYDTINNLTSQKETINGTAYTTSYTYDSSNRVTSKTTNGITVEYTYDALGRISQQVTKNGSTVILTETYTYVPNSSRIASCRTVATNYDITYSYTYDDNGNILSVNDGTNTTSYVYDTANQLVRENNQAGGYTHVWAYDDAGNILSRTEYAYTTGELGTAIDTASYGYDTNWGDLLTDYDHDQILYDTIGNPTYDGAREYIWEHGRELASITLGSTTWSFTYDANGMRTKRTDGTNTYTYVYNGSQLIKMTYNNDTLYFTYDASGIPVTVSYNGTIYYYATNLQGDIVGILAADGTQAVTYTYDAWGNILTRTGTMADTLGTINPLRYRGYVYDQETNLYYLQSRYYDPIVGRFINADALLTGQGLLGNNMFAYCGNNPISHKDPTGHCPEWIEAIIENLISLSNFFAKLRTTIKSFFSPKEREYIDSQKDDSIKKKKLGWSTVGDAGCGQVAIYNALITLGDSKGFNRILDYYNTHKSGLCLNGLLGTKSSSIVDYFESRGYTVYTTGEYDGVYAHSKYADACILFYVFSDDRHLGAHYFHYRRSGDGYYCYNNGGSYWFDSVNKLAKEDNAYFYYGIFIYK